MFFRAKYTIIITLFRLYIINVIAYIIYASALIIASCDSALSLQSSVGLNEEVFNQVVMRFYSQDIIGVPIFVQPSDAVKICDAYDRQGLLDEIDNIRKTVGESTRDGVRMEPVEAARKLYGKYKCRPLFVVAIYTRGDDGYNISYALFSMKGVDVSRLLYFISGGMDSMRFNTSDDIINKKENADIARIFGISQKHNYISGSRENDIVSIKLSNYRNVIKLKAHNEPLIRWGGEVLTIPSEYNVYIISKQ